MSKQEENKKMKREALLKAAFELFTDKGIDRTSITDIVEKAGIAKGTFYLYFKDKYELRNQVVYYKCRRGLKAAYDALCKTDIKAYEEQIIFLVDYIIDLFNEDKRLLSFFAKNYNWGTFKAAIMEPDEDNEVNVYQIYNSMLKETGRKFKNPEVMIFLIDELVISACYSPVLYNEPMDIAALKPYLYDTIRHIIKSQEI